MRVRIELLSPTNTRIFRMLGMISNLLQHFSPTIGQDYYIYMCVLLNLAASEPVSLNTKPEGTVNRSLKVLHYLFSPQSIVFVFFNSLLPCAQLHLQLGGRIEGQLLLFLLLCLFLLKRTLQLRLSS